MLNGLHVFCAGLAWSRVRFVRFAADERVATTFASLAECFEVLGGVPKIVLGGGRRGDPDSGLCAVRHPLPVRAGRLPRPRPGVQGIFEALVGYSKADLMVPLGVGSRQVNGSSRDRGSEPGREGLVRNSQRQSSWAEDAPQTVFTVILDLGPA